MHPSKPSLLQVTSLTRPLFQLFITFLRKRCEICCLPLVLITIVFSHFWTSTNPQIHFWKSKHSGEVSAVLCSLYIIHHRRTVPSITKTAFSKFIHRSMNIWGILFLETVFLEHFVQLCTDRCLQRLNCILQFYHSDGIFIALGPVLCCV